MGSEDRPEPEWLVVTRARLHELVDLLFDEHIHTGAVVTIEHGMRGGWTGSFDRIGGETVCWGVSPWKDETPPARMTREPRPPWKVNP